MGKMYTEEDLNKLDKDMLITLFLGLQAQMANLNQNMELLREQIAIMNQRKFGRSSEKNVVDSNAQGYMQDVDGELTVVFNEIDACYNNVCVEPAEEEVYPALKKRTRRPKGKRETDLSSFPCRVEMHELSDEQLHEIFGDKWKRLPDEVYKRLEYYPASHMVVEHHIAVYAGNDNQTIIKADRPVDLLKNSIVTPSLEAAILNGKYVNAMPLYRIEQEFLRDDIHISRQTMSNWTIRCAENYLSLLYDYLHQKMYDYHVLQADETPVLVNKDGRAAGSKSYMWVYRTGEMYRERPIVLYDYQKTRKQDHPEEFLKQFEGVLVTDGYQVYHSLEEKREDLNVAGCWSHARRKFAEVVKTFKSRNTATKTLANTALKQIQAMYRIEESLSGLNPNERKEQRQLSVNPLVEAFFAWLKEHRTDVPEKSATGKAITYCLNQEKYLRYFLIDGEVPMDNNAAERAIRGFCIGKKNWVMIDTIAGAKASAIIYSISETAKANHISTYNYFKYLLTEIPKHMNDKNLDFLERLLPWSESLPAECKKKKK